ncbi:hypothetical protein JVT61DRAFT_2058 [Boletus reticuloceps]|uniref:Exonuclease domain-containing protein n=1 Tax=Boletus reticuloceps TaxID=495285 RepID=A0A8I2YSN3_9AGAM|nr:hypothetical protein JVT61DRAFT_2058 [Boletus reticuloceps]
MLFLLTLVLFLFFVALLIILSRFSNIHPEENCSQPPLPEAPSESPKRSIPMPSISPVKVLNEPNRKVTSHVTKEHFPASFQTEAVGVKQPYDALLVLDVEATCLQGTGFDWPNEIIVCRISTRSPRRFLIIQRPKEWPVCLLRWKDKSLKGRASRLEIVDEFRSFVKPTWRPQLSQFCTDLTGITQAQVDYAPTFPKVLKMFERFLAQHGLIHPKTGRPLQRFCWCSDGPFDIRDFVVKQCFISNVPMPSWLRGDVLDVRKAVSVWAAMNKASDTQQINAKVPFKGEHTVESMSVKTVSSHPRVDNMSLSHTNQDARNIARIVIELARRGIRLEPNTRINPKRRWQWMGRPGEVLEYCLI